MRAAIVGILCLAYPVYSQNPDYNAHAPTVTITRPNTDVIRISEIARIGTPLFVYETNDADTSEANKKIDLEIVQGALPFALNLSSTTATLAQGFLSYNAMASAADNEYNVSLRASNPDATCAEGIDCATRLCETIDRPCESATKTIKIVPFVRFSDECDTFGPKYDKSLCNDTIRELDWTLPNTLPGSAFRARRTAPDIRNFKIIVWVPYLLNGLCPDQCNLAGVKTQVVGELWTPGTYAPDPQDNRCACLLAETEKSQATVRNLQPGVEYNFELKAFTFDQDTSGELYTEVFGWNNDAGRADALSTTSPTSTATSTATTTPTKPTTVSAAETQRSSATSLAPAAIGGIAAGSIALVGAGVWGVVLKQRGVFRSLGDPLL